MDYQKLCMHCMREKANAGDPCPFCGRRPSDYQMRSHVLPPFTILNGKYLVGEVLGAGGFGITYIALDMLLERVVAIKEFFLQGSMSRDGRSSSYVTVTGGDPYHEDLIRVTRAKFEDEAKTLAKLEKLPGIVYVIEYFMENDTSYIVLEYLDGTTLKDYVKQKGGRISFREVCEKLSPVMDSLTFLHARNILHRDISPDNIMVMRDGGMKLYDFGGAKQFSEDDDHRSVLVMKKAGYTPIEQYSNQEFGPWTDEYALAATMYYCITGKPPVEAIMRGYEEDCLEKPSSLGADLSEAEEAVLLKAMAVRPSRRYPGIPEFKQALQDAGRAGSGKTSDRPAGTEKAPGGSTGAGRQTSASGKSTGAGRQTSVPGKSTGAGRQSGTPGNNAGAGRQSGTPGNNAGTRRQNGTPDSGPQGGAAAGKSGTGGVQAPQTGQPKKRGAWPVILVLVAVGILYLSGNLRNPAIKKDSSQNRTEAADSRASDNPSASVPPTAKPTEKPPVKVTDKDMSVYDTATQYTDSEVVRLVQMILTDWGFGPLEADGRAGSGTSAKIREYQKDRGITENGYINEQFLVSLGVSDLTDGQNGTLTDGSAENAIAGFREKTEKITDTETIKQVQKALIEQGYDCGKVDGDIGETTRKLLIRYQRNHDLAESGYVDPELLDALKENEKKDTGRAESDGAAAATTVPALQTDKLISFADAGVKDHVMKWKEPAVEAYFRKKTGISSGDIRLSDIWETETVTVLAVKAEEKIADLGDFSELMNLTMVSILGCKEDAVLDLEPLANHPRLWRVCLSGGRVSDLSPLASCASLSSIDLPAGDVADFSPLSSVGKLDSLTLRGLESGRLDELKGLLRDPGRLYSLYLKESSPDVSALKAFTGLRTLNFEDCTLSQAEFDEIIQIAAEKMPDLKSLEISGSGIGEIGRVGKLTSLTDLDLGGNAISDLSGLKELKALKYLTLSDNRISDLSDLAGLTELVSLTLGRNEIEDIGPLKPLKNLTTLFLSGNKISDISVLKDLPALSSVYLRENPITDFSPVSRVKYVSK